MKRKIYVALLIAVLAIGISGCGKKSEQVSQALLKAGEQSYDEAMTILDGAEAAGEDEQLISRARGIICIGKADYASAEEYLLHALSFSNGKVGQTEYDISYYLALAEYKGGKIDEAIETYSAILSLESEESRTYYFRGCLYLEKEMYDEAIRDFNFAVDNDKQNPDLYIDIYEVLSSFGYEEQGKDYLDQAMALDTKFTDFQKGKMYYCQGDYESARTSLEKARSEEEGVILYLGRTYEALGDTNYAASLYKTYLEKEPDDVVVWNQLGLCQMALLDYDGALSSIQYALSHEDGSITQTLKYNEIVSYEYKGDFEHAADLMKTYMSTYPDDTTAAREYEFLKTR